MTQRLTPPARLGLPPRALLVVYSLLVCSAALVVAAPPPVRVTARIEPAHATIGTPLRYVLDVGAPRGVEVTVPALPGRIGDFRVVDFGRAPAREQGGRELVEYWYRLVGYDAGEHVIPGPTITYRGGSSGSGRADAPDVTVVLDSVLARDPGAKDIRSAKPPAPVPSDWMPFAIFFVVAALAMALGGWGVWWLWRRRRMPRGSPARSAGEIALEALDRLWADRLAEAGRYEEYYVRLSAVVRTYLEGRFGLRAPEMTTEEFLEAAPRNAELAAPARASLSSFLAEADLVKFARHVPERESAERAWRAARELVESTCTRPEARSAAA
jgi:hypothetical protein